MRGFIRMTLAAGLAGLITGCATPESPTASQDLAGNAAAPEQNVRECRYAEGTGSKMRYRICHSQAEWAAIDAATAQAQDTDDFFRGVRERASTGAGGGGGAALPGQ